MTEAEWLGCTDPTPMLEFLRGKVSDRKLRMFACACCRTVWPSIPAVFREAIRIAEEHADGRSTDVELGEAVSAAHRVRRKRNHLERAVYDAARSSSDAHGVARDVARVVASEAAPNPSPTAESRVVDGRVAIVEIPPDAARLRWDAAFDAHSRLESSLLRDLVGPLPFRPVGLQASVLSWNDGTVVALAGAIYDEQSFDLLRILADALEEAGCTEADILAHCRQQGEHVRGCWVVDSFVG
jgi:hypothetical protein